MRAGEMDKWQAAGDETRWHCTVTKKDMHFYVWQKKKYNMKRKEVNDLLCSLN